MQCRRNCWVWKPSPAYKLNTVPRSRVGIDVGAKSGTNMECSDGVVWNSKFNARAPGPEIQQSAHNPTVSRYSAGFRPGAVMLCSAQMQCWVPCKDAAHKNPGQSQSPPK